MKKNITRVGIGNAIGSGKSANVEAAVPELVELMCNDLLFGFKLPAAQPA